MDLSVHARSGAEATRPTVGELADALNGVIVMPALDRRVLDAAAAPDAHDRFERLAAVLQADPLLAARVLRVANSAYYGRTRAVGSIATALALLGTEAVCAIVLAASFDGVFARLPHGGALEGLRHHGLWTAALARRLAVFDGQSDCTADEAFVAGLMHDLGAMVIAQQRANLPQLAGLDHAFVGAALLSCWKMPPALVEAVRIHHHAEAGLPAGDVRAVLWTADALAHWTTDHAIDEYVVTPEQLQDHLGVTREELLVLAAEGSRDAREIEELIR